MNVRLFIAPIFIASILSAISFAAPVPDQLIGKVTVRNAVKLDAKANRELANIADKIKKSRKKGAIIITGDAASAKSQDDYITQAVFTARAVERQLTLLLSTKYQIFITAALYDRKIKPRNNSVSIRLYPHELTVMETDLTPFQATSQGLPETGAPVSALTAAPQQDGSGLLSPPQADDEGVAVTSKKERFKEYSEDPVRAQELVIRAKARAAARAKQLEQNK